jgi:predicted glycoside hydrolase/deacetylase ChbG (UPF0249 family)
MNSLPVHARTHTHTHTHTHTFTYIRTIASLTGQAFFYDVKLRYHPPLNVVHNNIMLGIRK